MKLLIDFFPILIFFIAYKQELEAIMAAAGNCRTFNRDTHALIPAHRIDGDDCGDGQWSIVVDFNHFATAIKPVSGHMMAAMLLATQAIHRQRGAGERIVGAAHAAFGGAFTGFLYGHNSIAPLGSWQQGR